jgi:putative peptidoglycan lipid II flippase
MAVTLLQLRVFYAMRDARTPTLIQVAMVLVRVPLLLLVPHVVGWQHAVAGVMVVTSATYLVGWVVGDVALGRRLGAARSPGVLSGVGRMAFVSAVAAVLAGLVVTITRGAFGTGVVGSLVTLVVGTVVIGIAVVAGAVVARVPEFSGLLAGVRARLGHPRGPGSSGA